MIKLLLTFMLCLFICIQSFQQAAQTNFNQDQATNVVNKTQASCNGKRIYLNKGGDNGIYIQGTSYSYNAGDTFVLRSSQNPYSYITMDYFTKGTDACPVVITNEGGQVLLTNYNGDAIPGGFSFTGSRHIKLTGAGSTKASYGFKVTTPDNRGLGVGISGQSSNFEIDHLEIYNKGSGMWIKQEADCSGSLQFPNWVLHDFNLHNNYIHNCQQEGMYLGSTDPNGTRAITCNGKTVYPKPLRLGNFYVHNNTFDSTGRGAIQLSNADSGKNEISSNTISHIGYEFNIYQGNGIVLGGYTHAYIHDNIIWNTYSSGIYSLGAGLVTIENNRVNYSGTLNGKTADGMASIMIDTRNTTNPSPGQHNPVMLTFIVKNNQLGSNTDYNVRVYNTYLTYNNDNAICGNTQISNGSAARYAVATGISYSTVCSGSKTKSITANSTNNDLSIYKNNASYLFPNPAGDVLNVLLKNKIAGKVILNIFDAKGSLLQSAGFYKNSGETSKILNVKTLNAGLYTLQILSGENKINLKFIKR